MRTGDPGNMAAGKYILGTGGAKGMFAHSALDFTTGVTVIHFVCRTALRAGKIYHLSYPFQTAVYQRIVIKEKTRI